ncbi:mCG145650, partial [Mus musculus]
NRTPTKEDISQINIIEQTCLARSPLSPLRPFTLKPGVLRQRSCSDSQHLLLTSTSLWKTPSNGLVEYKTNQLKTGYNNV